jgi:hypothetical protein
MRELPRAAPPGGATVKRDWIVHYSELPPVPDRLFTLQSWDTASKGGPEKLRTYYSFDY